MEVYVRRLIRDFVAYHPVLVPYQNRIKLVLTDNGFYEYQLAVIYAGLKYRAIQNLDDLLISEEDGEKAKVKDSAKIGLPDLEPSDLQNPDISEQLFLKIYEFVNTDQQGGVWITTYEKEQMKLKEKERDNSKEVAEANQKESLEGEEGKAPTP